MSNVPNNTYRDNSSLSLNIFSSTLIKASLIVICSLKYTDVIIEPVSTISSCIPSSYAFKSFELINADAVLYNAVLIKFLSNIYISTGSPALIIDSSLAILSSV